MKIKIFENKKMVAKTITILILGVISIFLFFTPKNEQNFVREREYVVKKDNITVGIETSGQISTLPNIHTFEEKTVIDEIFVKVGSEVKKGDKLATISSDDLSELIESAKDELSDAKAALLQASSTKDVIFKQNDKNKQDGENHILQEFDGKLEELLGDKAKIEKKSKEYEVEIINLEKKISELSSQVKESENKISSLQTQINANVLYVGEQNEKLLKVDDAYEEMNEIRIKIIKLQNENIALQQELDSLLEEPVVSELKESIKEKTIAEDALEKEYIAFSLKIEEILKVEKQYAQALEKQGKDNIFADYKVSEEVKAISENIAKANRNVGHSGEKLRKLLDLEKNPALYAQMDGVVTEVNYNVGDMVIDGNPVCVIGQLSEITMTAPISAADIGNVSVGQVVNIFVDAFSEQKFIGTVTGKFFVANDNGDYPVTIQIEPTDQMALPGMKAFATIILREKKDILTISNKAILLENSVQYVNLKKENGELLKTKIVTGFSDGRISEVLTGLSENDIVIVQE